MDTDGGPLLSRVGRGVLTVGKIVVVNAEKHLIRKQLNPSAHRSGVVLYVPHP